MKRWLAVAVVWSVAVVAMGQSLGSVAKKEKVRRKKNQEEGIQSRIVTEAEVRSLRPVSSTETPASETNQTAADIEAAIKETVGGPESGSSTPAVNTTPQILGVAPSFDLRDQSGRAHSLTDFQGKPVLIDFWATWCGPCRSTMPHVENLHRKYRSRGLQVVGINIEGKSKEVLDFVSASRYSFLMLFDSGNWKSVVAQQYGVSSIPRTFLIDGEGNIVFSGHPNQLQESLIESTLN